MRIRRIHSPLALQQHTQVVLGDDACRHLVKVLRLKSGDAFVLFDGSGCDFAARLQHVSKQGCTAEVGEILRQEDPPELQVSLAIGISRGERMDFSIQKAVELGVGHIIPLFTERSMVQLKGSRLQGRLQHWQGVIRHACEQSGRSRLPTLSAARSLPEWLHGFHGQGVLLDHRADATLIDIPAPRQELTLLAGPEGGLSPHERESAARSGLRAVRLGPRILRTETAPLAALSVIQTLWGDFR